MEHKLKFPRFGANSQRTARRERTQLDNICRGAGAGVTPLRNAVFILAGPYPPHPLR